MNDKGEKKELGRQKSNRLKFLEACEGFDLDKRGFLPQYSVERVFTSCRFLPYPTSSEYNKLFKALEIYGGDDNAEVNYQKLLKAPNRRETTSLNGIFPKIVSSAKVISK